MSDSTTGKRWMGAALLLLAFGIAGLRLKGDDVNNGKDTASDNALQLVSQGRQIFRFDTFGDQAFWGDTLKLHLAIEGAAHGGTGPGLSPKAAIAAGLKVDIDALGGDLAHQLETGGVNLDDPAATLVLLKRNAVIGVTGIFNSNGTLQSVGDSM